MTPAYFDQVRPTYIENWGHALTDLSIPQTDIPLGLEETRALAAAVFSSCARRGGGASAAGGPRDARDALGPLAERLARALRAYPRGAFVRLGSRSAKDSAYALGHGLRVADAPTALRMLTGDSRRLAFDLRLCLRHHYRPHVFVREWLDVPAWSEFRCFMRGRELVGVSQYDCKNLGRRQEIVANAARIEAGVRAFFGRLRAASHLDDVVFDVFVSLDGEGPAEPAGVRLLELNPFFAGTDACLFDWHGGGDFDGSFRFL